MLARSAYVHKPEDSYTRLDPCTGRMIRFTSNKQGGRGAEWTIAYPPDVTRLICMGDSSVYGVNNPDEATWPALLEKIAASTEVFNAGLPGHSMQDFIFFFHNKIAQYNADKVLLYGAWNNTLMPGASQVATNVRRLHTNSILGQLVSGLYNRSTLYTYLLEKVYFLRAGLGDDTLPDVDNFRRKLEQFIEVVRSSGAEPVLVLQMVEPLQNQSVQYFLRGLRTLNLTDARQVRATLINAVENEKSLEYDRVTWLRVYQTQLLLEVTRRVGSRLRVQVVDPSAGFAEYNGIESLFCDAVHLSDSGNLVLAEQVAKQVQL